jgi:hypothetical protein
MPRFVRSRCRETRTDLDLPRANDFSAQGGSVFASAEAQGSNTPVPNLKGGHRGASFPHLLAVAGRPGVIEGSRAELGTLDLNPYP